MTKVETTSPWAMDRGFKCLFSCNCKMDLGLVNGSCISALACSYLFDNPRAGGESKVHIGYPEARQVRDNAVSVINNGGDVSTWVLR